MNFEQLNKKIQSISWYKQAAAAKPLGFSYPLVTYFEQTINSHSISIVNNDMITVSGNNYLSLWHNRNSLELTAKYYLQQQKDDSSFARQLKYKWDLKVNKLRDFIQQEERKKLSKYTDKALLELFNKFSSDLTYLWRESIFHDSFDLTGEDILKREAVKINIKLSYADLVLLGSLVEYSWMQCEIRDLLTIYNSISNEIKLNKILDKPDAEVFIQKQYPELFKKITVHTAKYHWLYYDYEVIKPLVVKDFLIKLQRFFDKNYKNKIEQELEEVGRVKTYKDKLVEQKKLSTEFMSIVELLEVVAKWRDDRKVINQMSNGLIHKFLQEFAKRSNYNVEEIEQLYWWEINGIVDSSQDAHLKQLIVDRFAGYVCYEHLKNGISFFGDEAQQLKVTLEKQFDRKSLKGRPAYHGVIRGTVRIVRNQSEFYKMNKGDILVTPSTRPEYVPIMKLAVAIISEEGGLTCHAAIVSRELKIPAIVGVQGAIQVLKDGDQIEVDADKGVVRKINS